MYPRQSATTHTEQLGDEASIYDWARGQVHALNPTAARVWRQCDGATSPAAIAAALRVETGLLEADAVVDLTLKQLARVHLLELPVESHGDRSTSTRRWLLGRGLTAALLPAIYSIVAPSPVEAQSAGASAPTLTSLSPTQGLQGTTVAVTLTGTNFVAGGTTVNVSGAGVTVTGVTVGSAAALASRRRTTAQAAVSSTTSLTVSLVIDPAAAEGPRNVTVTTGAGTSSAQIFTVTVPLTAGTPTLTSVAPNQGTRGTTVAVTLAGTNFVVGATTVTVGGTGATVTNVVVSSGTALTANVVIDPTASEGLRTVAVTTAVGTSEPRVFAITPPASGVPTLTSVIPNLGVQGTTVLVTLTGASFVVGATMVAISGTGVTVSNVAVGSTTSLTASFALDPAAATGPRTVTVTTAAGTSGAQTFTIDPPPPPGTPTLLSPSPNQGIQGTTVAVTLTGTNFVVGATTVTVGGSGVTVTNVVVGNTTSLTANFVLDPAAAVGARTVTVTTAGGTSAPRVFTINLPPPTLAGISPNQGLRGATVAVTLTGTNFAAGLTVVNVNGAGVTATNVVVVSPTSLTASVFVDPAAAVGGRTVTVTTAAGTSGPQTFTVNPAAPGSATFNFTGTEQTFTVPTGVVSVTIVATGAQAGSGLGTLAGVGGLGGRTTATVSVTPGASLTVRVGGVGPNGFSQSFATPGGFNGGGASQADGGGGGGASSVRDGFTPLVVVGGGGGGGGEDTLIASGGGGNGGAGGGLNGSVGQTVGSGGGPGGGGGQNVGGPGGNRSTNSYNSNTSGTVGMAGSGGVGGGDLGQCGGGGGGGGYFGGGGGGGGSQTDNRGGGGGGGGSSFTAPGATGVVHQQGVNSGAGSVTISW